MYTLHGFVTINSIVSNEKNIVSPLGELGAVSETYAKDKGYYTLPSVPNIRLISFNSKQDNNDIVVPTYVVEKSIQLSQWLSSKALSGGFINNRDVITQAVVAEFRTQLTKIRLGRIVAMDGNTFLPEFIEFSILNKPENSIKLWFSDNSFMQQYPFYDIVPIPIVEDLEKFFGSNEEVLGIESDKLLPRIHQRANALRANSPYTNIFTFNFEWVSPTDKHTKRIFPWTILVYGNVGENMDVIREAITNYILAHSGHARSEWEKIFPDLFIPTEYILAPFWEKQSIPNRAIIAGMFAPSIALKDILPHSKPIFVGYTEEHLKDKLEISSILYKSAAFAVCGHANNRLADPSFYKQWPEYALIRSVSDDFNRFDKDTQQLVKHLNTLFKHADEANLDSELPSGVTRVKRGDIYYVSLNYKGVTYLCAMRWNYLEGSLKPSE